MARFVVGLHASRKNVKMGLEKYLVPIWQTKAENTNQNNACVPTFRNYTCGSGTAKIHALTAAAPRFCSGEGKA